MRSTLFRCSALLGLLWSASVLGLAPEKPFEQMAVDNWGLAEGLPHRSVRALVQGADGYLWAGTAAGLVRFDGVSSRVYEPENTSALAAKLIRSLLVDGRGRMWIGTERGLTRYDGRQFQAVTLKGAEGAENAVVLELATLTDGTVVAATSRGLFRQRDELVFERVPGLTAQRASAIHAARDTLWVGFADALLALDLKSLSLRASYPIRGASSVIEYAGTTWAGASDGVHRMEQGQFAALKSPEGHEYRWVESMLIDRDGVLWIGANHDLLRFRGRELIETVNRVGGAGLRGVIGSIEDREGNLWLGDYGEGLFRVWNGNMERWSADAGLEEAVAKSLGRWREGRLWVGTNSGLQVFDGERFGARIDLGPNSTQPVLVIYEETDRTWLGLNQSLVGFRRDGTHLPGTESVKIGSIRSILRDGRGRLWVSGAYGVMRESDEGFVGVPLGAGYRGGPIFALVEDGEGTLHATGSGGIQALRGEAFEAVELPERLLVAEPSTMIALDGNDLLVGTNSPMLAWRHEGRWHLFDERDGLPHNPSTSLGVDRHGTLWVSGQRGLHRLPVQDLAARAAGTLPRLRARMVLSVSGTVPGAQFTECCTSSGSSSMSFDDTHVWLTSDDGIVRAPLAETATNPIEPRVHIQRLRFGGQWHDLEGGEPVSLPVDARNLSFEYTALSFRDPKSVTLSHRLVGYEDEWQTLDDALSRRISYTNLAPGDYVFEARGANESGVWSVEPARLSLSIAPRFFETLWFRVTLALALLLAIYAAIAWRTRALRRERTRLAQLVAERTAALDAANLSLLEASETDPLTKLRNRRYLHDHLPADIQALQSKLAADPLSEDVLAFVVADIDHFKRINDVHGHAAGDEVLRAFARVLRDAALPGDHVVRWGGEEFVLVMRGRRGRIGLVAESLRRAVATMQHRRHDDVPLPLTASFGAIEYPLSTLRCDALAWQDYVELADRALYLAKQNGRDTFALCQPGRTLPAALAASAAPATVDTLLASDAVHFVLRAQLVAIDDGAIATPASA